MANSHYRRRRDETIEFRRVGDVKWTLCGFTLKFHRIPRGFHEDARKVLRGI